MTLQTSVSASSGATKVETPDSEVSGSAIAAVDDRSTHATIKPPADHELWSYVEDDGKRFLQFSAVSRICLGSALVFLSLHGTWLLALLPFGAAVVIGGLINLLWSTQIPAFDRSRHSTLVRRVRAAGKGASDTLASVDVFICTCGEDPDIVENTICHAMWLEHPNVRVYVLDDRNSDAIRQAALRWGANYLSRPNRGWMKKSGNLHHGYASSDGDLILVLDADFAVRPDFLTHTIGYFEDPRLGILQTPQFFRTASDNWVERGAAAQQEQFYRVGLRARDKHGGAICVGTNAVYRRSALDERGGMALLEHSEDIFTGLKVVDAGYRVDYLPLPLAAGTAPDNAAALASQQYRWARGNFALAGTPLFKRMRLTPMQRLGMWDGWIFYVTSALSPLVALFVPIVSLLEAPHLITLAPAAMILPAIFTEFYLQPRWLHLPDGPASRRVGLISQVAHLSALRDHLTDRDQEWIPTGETRHKRDGTDRIPDMIAVGALLGYLAILGLLAFRIATGWPLIDLAPVGVLATIALPAALGVARNPVVRRPAVEAHTDTGRDPFLDMVRTISIVRVMFWHALGFWWISWAFAAMPAVFYVSGAVLARSLRHSGTWSVVRGRLERLLPPYYAYVAVCLGVVAIAPSVGGRDDPTAVLSWIIPYRAPATLGWEGGWLSTPLWFLRALALVLLLTPLVRPLGRRIPGILQFAAWGLTLFALDRLVAAQTTSEATAVARGVADVVCFGGFFALGVGGHHLRHRFDRLARLQLTAIFVIGALSWATISPPAGLVVNNSYALFGLVGLAWLSGMLAIEDHLRHLGNMPAVRAFVDWVTRWAMSIYLWHTVAVVIAYRVVGAPQSLAQWLLFGALFAVTLRVVVNAVRPLESVWLSRGRSRPRWQPLSLAALVTVGGLIAVQPALFPAFEDIPGPPTPSGRPPVGGLPLDLGNDPTPSEAAAMARSAEAWLVGHGVAAASVVEIGATTGGRPVTVQFGDVDVLDPDATFEALSLTKTMVAVVALQLVNEGRMTLDGPLPPLQGVAVQTTEAMTLRRLLSHSSGLIDYRQSTSYRNDAILSPLDAVAIGLEGSDLTSTTSSYAATNYLVVGLAIETVTGQPLSEVLQERIFVPLQMSDTTLVNNQREGFVGFASGGVVSTLEDLSLWFDALLRSRSLLPPELHDELLFGGGSFQRNAGLGLWRHCPCDGPTRAESEPFLYAFHDGGDTRLVYIPSRDSVIAMRFSKPLYDQDRIIDGIDDFVFAVADRREFVRTGD